jgi:hypothetical protein
LSEFLSRAVYVNYIYSLDRFFLSPVDLNDFNLDDLSKTENRTPAQGSTSTVKNPSQASIAFAKPTTSASSETGVRN